MAFGPVSARRPYRPKGATGRASAFAEPARLSAVNGGDEMIAFWFKIRIHEAVPVFVKQVLLLAIGPPNPPPGR